MNEGWKFAASSGIGTSHLSAEGGVCQDAHGCRYFEEHSTMVCVVSDGAGSASYAELGSKAACQETLEAIASATTEQLFSGEFGRLTVRRIQALLTSMAEERNSTIRQFACTLLVAIVDTKRAAFWQIGDGAICFRIAGEQEFKFAFWPTKGEYANMTAFVTDSNADEIVDLDFGVFPVADLALFSDGIERLALDFKAQEAHTPFLAPLFPRLRVAPLGRAATLETEMLRFLSSDAVNSRTDDDKTLVLATLERQEYS